jgi:hypothetical protein
MEEWTAIRIVPVLFMMENVITIKISAYIYIYICKLGVVILYWQSTKGHIYVL